MPSQQRRTLAELVSSIRSRSNTVEDLCLLEIVSVLVLCDKALPDSGSGIVADLDNTRHRLDKESCYLCRCCTLAGRQEEALCLGP
jgi:hypothetical protein